MSRIYETVEQETGKEETVDNYKDLFLSLIEENPSLEDALDELYMTLNLTNIETQRKYVIKECKRHLENKFKKIKETHPNVTKDEALTICTYTYEDAKQELSPYKILNRNLISNDRRNGIKKVCKYFFILLKAIRHLTPFNANDIILYRALRKKIATEIPIDNPNYIPYKEGNEKKFWSFTSTTPKLETATYFLGNREDNLREGTRFIIHGDIVGYDITPFSCYENEKEILLEPERKFKIEGVNEVNEIINVTIKILKTPLVLEDIIKTTNQEKKEDEKEDENSANTKNIFGTNEIIDNKINEKSKENIKLIDDSINKNINKTDNVTKQITMIYKKDNNKNKIQILGEDFVKNNKINCKMIINNNEYDIESHIEDGQYGINGNNEPLSLILTGINNITDTSNMFYLCTSLESLPDISKWDTKNVTNMSNMFGGCCSLKSLLGISQWNTKSVNDMSNMFCGCTSLLSFPDISKWDTKNVTNMSNMFDGCTSLESLPDISKWDTKNVTNMSNIFNQCSSLKSLPDISKWDIGNVKDMSKMLNQCSSLKSLPDISKWDTKSAINMSNLFGECSTLKSLPDISKWDIGNVECIDGIFYECSSLKSLPDISKWDTRNVTDMSNMFDGCNSLQSLPKISKWNTKRVESIDGMFNECSPNLKIPHKFKNRKECIIF